ncbi:MAG: hypothetical protein JJE52_17635 [Acidimicrobiia bacterium]|nr:hypothetical protein [Acidimicrobiia bacterium]
MRPRVLDDAPLVVVVVVDRRDATACRAMTDQLGTHIACVKVDLIPDPELVRLARLVVSGVASVAAMGLEEVEDCRAAVDEMCSSLLECGSDDGDLHLEFTSDGHLVEVTGQMALGRDVQLDPIRQELSGMILDAVTDEHDLTFTGGVGRFRFVKVAASRGASR